MDVGTTLVLIFVLTLALVTALPRNDQESDIGVCGNTCKVNEFCDESQEICLDCSVCVTSGYCAKQDCNGGNNTNATTNALHQTTKAPEMSQPGSPFIHQSSRPTVDDKDDDGDMKSSKNESRENGDTKRNMFLTSTIAICGGFAVACVGVYMYLFHPLGLRSQEITKERDQMAGIYLEEIYRRGNNKATEKVPLQ
ncbi:uncharacterized protein LOC105441669 isoform X2 [Strongylocentrotus purpuratus]|uniref:Uncharacterized protein n=1 Tax=Strongylocentrotus purpuratus TaxID=7668 RepID=A0A7M7LT69_STRPU|nr:uncharacterized protein LOC105441669 isoform X2 [Strongylocentrotus purpuratus]